MTTDTHTETRNTPLTQKHIALGAKMVPFAGYKMPIQYAGIMAEHKAVRESVGLFDLSHMGEFEVAGPGMLEFLETMTTNDVGALYPFQAQYSLMLNDDGGIVDDLLVYHLPGRAMLVVNAANIEKDFDWLQSHCPDTVKLTNKSYDTALVAIQGPKSVEVMKEIVDFNPDDLKYYHAAEGSVDGKTIVFSRTGYTGEDGFEIYMPNELAEGCWDAAMQIGAQFDIKPVGLGARDTLRMEMKFALYGNDIDDTTNPIEAGLGWVVKPDKAITFIGRDKVVEVKENKPQRKLTAFTIDDRGIPRQGCDICVGDETVGTVTSGTQSPSLGKGIGLGYVHVPHNKIGTSIEIDVRGRRLAATIIKPPFMKNTSHK
ncbi:MAG: glycine cleavage system aminomethyltransferase GcvT [candidate division Zixibacteria bacterium]|nr:glycine cleavage system aminomethyltransferase GcvT [candidate division Zixibacteria bacterium]